MTRRNDGDLPVPLEGIADAPITRARAIKLAGAMGATGAFALFTGGAADAATAAQRRRRRRRRRRRQRQRDIVSNTNNESLVDLLDLSSGDIVDLTDAVTVTNNGDVPVTLRPEVVGDGFRLLDTGNIRLDPGETRVVPLNLEVLEDGADALTLRLVDARDGLVLETVRLAADVL